MTNSVSVGAFLTNRISATTTNPPLVYQWQLNGAAISNATNALLILTNIQPAAAGNYVMVVMDGDASVSSSAWVVEVDAAFTKITGDPCVAPVGRATGVAWGDYNNDGYPDLFVSIVNGANVQFTNNGNGTFTRVITGPIVTGSATSSGGAWGDYDNDGFLDLFVPVNSGSDLLYRNGGSGVFTRTTTGSIVTSGGRGNGCAWGDYDNDGYLDLYVCNSDQSNFLYHNNRNGTFTRVTSGPPVTATGNSQGCAWGDYDNDGNVDLFVTHYLSKNSLYHNNGNGTLSLVTNEPMVVDSSAGPCVWGDYNNDGFLDLFVGAQTGGTNLLYHNNGNGTFTKVVAGPLGNDTGNSIGAGWADYDNDGSLDLFVAQYGHPGQLYHNNGDGTFARIASGSLVADGGTGGGCAWGDYNNDGFPDLFVTGNNADYLYKNNGNTNHWITVQCLGRISNRAAIGAKVRIKATVGGRSMWQMREISGGNGTGSQNDLRCQFGLREATNVNIVRIEWPSGMVQEFANVLAGQFFSVKEPSRLAAEVEPQTGGVQVKLMGGKGLVYLAEQSNDLRGWTPIARLTNDTGTVIWTAPPGSTVPVFIRASE